MDHPDTATLTTERRPTKQKAQQKTEMIRTWNHPHPKNGGEPGVLEG